jgi:hypothetical protein
LCGTTVLFIDSQQYLDFYELPSLKLLLGTLAAVSDRVFVTTQIADEVTRNKVGVALKFFTNKGVPDQLIGETVSGELQAKAIRDGVVGTREAGDKPVGDLLQQIGRSEDEVSRVFARIFARAVEANESELKRARERKERGRAPGKPRDALGDQINWEQFLTCAEKWSQVWIISRDGDYCHKYAETVILNASLYQDLTQRRPGIVVHCFTEMERGLRDFIKVNPVPGAKLPTPDEAELINKEQQSLPPLGWLDSGDDGTYVIAMQEAAKRRWSAAWMRNSVNPWESVEGLPPPGS